MLTASVPDPDGGLPWGLRSFHTTRGLVCLQIGRVQQGKLGILGRDDAFRDDGRFHELRPGVLSSPVQCSPPDGAGNGFLTFHNGGQPASGGASGCGLPQAARCPAGALRSVDWGLLGPEATAVSYRDGDRTRTIPTLGPEGGYLVVGRHTPPKNVPPGGVPGGYMVAFTPVSPIITHVQYGTAATCTVEHDPASRAPGREGGCPDPPGFTPIPQPAAANVRAKVSARPGPGSSIRVRFVARVAVTDRLSAYNVTVYSPRSAIRCPTRDREGNKLVPPPGPGARCGSIAVGETTDSNLAAGQTVVKTIPLGRRPPGRYRVVVKHSTQPPRPGPLDLELMRLGPDGTPVVPGVLVGTAVAVVRG